MSYRFPKLVHRLAPLFFFIILLFVFGCNNAALTSPQNAGGLQAITQAYAQKESHILVEAEGEIIKVLPDDLEGSRHQRFIIRLPTGQTLLIAHNIDIADRIPGIKEGEKIRFHGIYEWNTKGGVIHWTHHDPAGRFPGGWIVYEGKKYQ